MSYQTGSTKSMLFYRDFRSYTGGHQKVIDYFGHVSLSKGYCPFISFSAQTRLDDSNPWTKLLCGESAPYKGAHVPEYISGNYDTLFLAGLDWHKYLETNASIDKPVINLIQHVRHADPESDVYPFLNQRAIRICVAQEVTEAIQATDRVNGPVFTIPNGHSIEQVPQKKQQDIFILSTKNPVLGKELYSKMIDAGFSVSIVDSYKPRDKILSEMAKSRVSLTLPHKTEGFYLPALEAMALSDLAVVPDCVGNRGFCENELNCLMPEYTSTAIEKVLLEALSLTQSNIKNLPKKILRKFHVNKALGYHSLERERKQFLDILGNLEQIW